MHSVKDVTKKKIISVKRSTSLTQLLNLFKDFHTFPLVPVVDDKDMLVGVVYLRNLIETFKPHHLDILRTIPLLDRQEMDILDLEIEPGMGDLIIVDDMMERKFLAVRETESIDKTYNLMKLHSRETLPVVDAQNKLVGIVGVFDILMEVIKSKGLLE